MSYTKQQRGNVLKSVKNISSAILGVGVDDTTIDLFESQYPVPTGVSYNSYIIRDEKTAILDTVDARATDEWMANVTEALAGEKPAYLVVHHMSRTTAQMWPASPPSTPRCRWWATPRPSSIWSSSSARRPSPRSAASS